MRSRAEPSVGLDLRLARPPRADAAAEALEVGPQAAHAREVVLELRELDLELALGAVRVRGEDVEDHGRAVDHRQAERLLEVALLAGAQLVVAGDHVRVARQRRGLRLGHLARAEIGVRVRLLAALDHLADDGHAGRAQQLAELGEVVALGSAAMQNARWRARWRAARCRYGLNPSTPSLGPPVEHAAGERARRGDLNPRACPAAAPPRAGARRASSARSGTSPRRPDRRRRPG